MAPLFGLPDLNKTFCNIEHGLDGEHVTVTDIPNDDFQLLHAAISSSNHNDDEIKSNHSVISSPPTSLPPDIEFLSPGICVKQIAPPSFVPP